MEDHNPLSKHIDHIKKFDRKKFNDIQLAIPTTAQEAEIARLCESSLEWLYHRLTAAGFTGSVGKRRKMVVTQVLLSQVLFDIPGIWELGLEQPQAKQVTPEDDSPEDTLIP